jgi:hypothetical protein
MLRKDKMFRIGTRHLSGAFVRPSSHQSYSAFTSEAIRDVRMVRRRNAAETIRGDQKNFNGFAQGAGGEPGMLPAPPAKGK